MSHNPHETIICPNCGYHATYNYCAECGQETHLHKETFWGLVGHFIGHYFHYDSKFWKTMKLLWFHPGALTIAYAKKQRNRFIPPISLYIFISFVFFLSLSVVDKLHDKPMEKAAAEARADSARLARTLVHEGGKDTARGYVTSVDNAIVNTRIGIKNMDVKKGEEIAEKIQHGAPKVFFFMIPLMAALLKLLFIRRKDLYFVDHAVFSLHYHSFWFSAMLLSFIDPFENISWLSYSIVIASAVVVMAYFAAAIKHVYQTGWIKAISYMLIISLVYLVVLAAIFIGSVAYMAVA